MRKTYDIGGNFPEITRARADAFADELLKIEESGFQEVVLDFSNIEVISSVAMSRLFDTYQRLTEQKRVMRIANVGDNVRRLLKLLNLGGIIE